MKRVFFTLTAIAALSLASCKKDRTCTCITSYNGIADDADVTVINDATKSQAKANCVDMSSVDGLSKRDCELK